MTAVKHLDSEPSIIGPMSFCTIFGFFPVGGVSHLEFATVDPLVKLSFSMPIRPVSLVPIYKTGITNTNTAITSTTVWAPSPFRGQLVEQGAFVFVVRVLCIRPAGEQCLINVSQMELFPCIFYHPHVPPGRIFTPFPALYVTVLGVVTGPQYCLSDRKTVVPIQVSQSVWGSLQTFELVWVLFISIDGHRLNSKLTGVSYRLLNSC